MQLIDDGDLPGATMSFKKISFFGAGVEKMLKNYDIGQMSEEEKREDEAFSQFDNLIASSLRDAGNHDYGKARAQRIYALRNAAYQFPSMQSAEDALPLLVHFQLTSQSDTEFLSRVREEFANMLRHENEADQE